MPTLKTCLLVLFTLALAVPAAAKDEVVWSLRLEPADARAGEHAQVVAEAKVAPGWHIYTIKPAPGGGPRPTKVELLPGSALTPTGPATEPTPHTEFDK